MVSIIMPTFNAARTVRRAVDSIMAQTHADWRLICIDDASSDETVSVLTSYVARLGSRLVVHTLRDNGGPARARNKGLELSRGAWVSIIDADDAWRPERLARLLQVASRDHADVVCDNLVGFDDHSGQETEPLFTILPRTLDIGMAAAAEYQGRYNLGYLKPLVRRSFLESAAIRYDEALRTGEDLLFLLSCLAKGGRVSCHDAPGYIYTTPVGHGSGKLSRSTTTSPRDADLAHALRHFVDVHRNALTPADVDALQRRIAYLADIAPLASFRHARLNRRWAMALRLFLASPQVRRQVLSAAWPGRGKSPRKWA